MVASKAELGGIVYAGVRLLNEKTAGGLPERVMPVATPNKLYALNLSARR